MKFQGINADSLRDQFPGKTDEEIAQIVFASAYRGRMRALQNRRIDRLLSEPKEEKPNNWRSNGRHTKSKTLLKTPAKNSIFE